MKRFVVVGLVAFFAVGRVGAQTSLDALEDDLKAAKVQHDAATSQAMSTFLSTLQNASQSPSYALDLYKKAGGNLPDAAPVRHHYEYETPSEKAQREAIDANNFESVAIVIQVHCGLMRNAALLTVTPKAPGVQEQWMDWLKTTADIYPQLAGPRALKNVAMRDSVVSDFLGFHGWDDSDASRWSVADLPRLYHDLVLEPLRHPPGPGTTDAWDTYIAMLQADEPDKDKWTTQEEPNLDFNRDADDYAAEPSMDKLAALDVIIKSNPTDDHLDDWIKRMQAMIDSYRRGGTSPTPPAPAASAPASTPAQTTGAPAVSAPGQVPATTATGVPTPASS